LFEIEGLTGEEIAELEGTTPAAVRVRICRARAHVVERLRKVK
jgi:DNA-directed RNA polymerase specialized sigma24 family protein